MVFNHVNCKNITNKDEELFVLVTNIIYALSDEWKKSRIRPLDMEYLNFNCHSICRAISIISPDLHVVSGSYVGLKHISLKEDDLKLDPCWNDHSWLVTPDGAIIDPHPVGVITVAPLLAVGKGKNAPHGYGLYVPDWRIVTKITNRKLIRQSHCLHEFIKRLITK